MVLSLSQKSLQKFTRLNRARLRRLQNLKSSDLSRDFPLQAAVVYTHYRHLARKLILILPSIVAKDVYWSGFPVTNIQIVHGGIRSRDLMHYNSQACFSYRLLWFYCNLIFCGVPFYEIDIK